jgi:uncharacterized protein (TIGR02452 family)
MKYLDTDKTMNVRKEIFTDTKRAYESVERLRDAVEESKQNQFIELEDATMADDNSHDHRYGRKADIVVSTKRSFEAASEYVNQKKKICVLNFANAFHPGGGVEEGCSAQEESLCRCSTLYACISADAMKKNFYKRHWISWLKGDFSNLANDDCIYTPAVVVFKSDDAEPKMLPEEEWYETDVITCAAPDLRKPIRIPGRIKSIMPGKGRLQNIHEQRGRRILEMARQQHVDVLILGAFGCGAFVNRPEAVACAYKKILEDYRYDFDTIEFAIAGDNRNYKVFQEALGVNDVS